MEQLLEAGADPRELNKNGDKPVDMVNASTPLGKELYDSLRKAEAQAGIDVADIAGVSLATGGGAVCRIQD